ncbi:hypothetical protein PAHAL_1G435700 [Panicum hallii]|nr:hypothetical protein PAHAL_1G435700 [Panicum hallii]
MAAGDWRDGESLATLQLATLMPLSNAAQFSFLLLFGGKKAKIANKLASQHGATGFGTYGRRRLTDCFYNFQLSEFFIVPLEKVSRACIQVTCSFLQT